MEQANILRHTVDALERLSVPYVIVGSIASIAYGEVRFTFDIDILVALEIRQVEGLVAAFPATDFYCNAESIREAVRNNSQFNILHPATGNKIDFILPQANEWGRTHFSRRRSIRLLPDRDVMAASPEDVIVGKLWYYSLGGGDRHLRDITGILRVSGPEVDRSVVQFWATQLGLSELWQQVLAKIDDPEATPKSVE